MDKKYIIKYINQKFDLPKNILNNLSDYLYSDKYFIYDFNLPLCVEFEENINNIFSIRIIKYLKKYFKNIQLKEGELILKSIMHCNEYLYVHYNKKYKKYELHPFNTNHRSYNSFGVFQDNSYTFLPTNVLGFKYFEPGYHYKGKMDDENSTIYNPNPDYTTELYPIDLIFLKNFEIKEIDNKYIDGLSYSTFLFRDKSYIVIYQNKLINRLFENDIGYFFIERYDSDFFVKLKNDNLTQFNNIKIQSSHYMFNTFLESINSKYSSKYLSGDKFKYIEYINIKSFCKEILINYDCILAPFLNDFDFKYTIENFEYNHEDSEDLIEDILEYNNKLEKEYETINTFIDTNYISEDSDID